MEAKLKSDTLRRVDDLGQYGEALEMQYEYWRWLRSARGVDYMLRMSRHVEAEGGARSFAGTPVTREVEIDISCILRALEEGSPYYVGREVTALMQGTFAKLPLQSVLYEDMLPEPYGFVWFERPIATVLVPAGTAVPWQGKVHTMPTDWQLRLHGFSWTQHWVLTFLPEVDFAARYGRMPGFPAVLDDSRTMVTTDKQWPAYVREGDVIASHRVYLIGLFDQERTGFGQRRVSPQEYLDWELGQPLQTVLQTVELDNPDNPYPLENLTATAQVAAAFFSFVQTRLVESHPSVADRATRRRIEREGAFAAKPRALAPQAGGEYVRCIVLRRKVRESVAPTDADDNQERESPDWQCRWIVRAHWRQQFYPSLRDHRWKLIPPYVKGPADRPLKVPEHKLFVVER